MKNNELTPEQKIEAQREVDSAFAQTKELWEQLKTESGKSEALFILSKEGSQFLGEFEVIRQTVLGMGLTVPKLLDNVSVMLVEEDELNEPTESQTLH